MSRVTLFLGRANTGKSREIFSRLAAHQRAGEKAVLIVPEQYTFEAERTLAEMQGGLLGVEVLSFARLNERILALSGQTAPFLSPQGHRMVIRRCALINKEALTAFRGVCEKPGFAAEMQTVFSDLTRAGLAPTQLAAFADTLPEGTPLRQKLTDIALLYEKTEAFLAEKYLTLDAAADRARELMPGSYLFGLPVYIDGIDRPSRQLYRWLATLMGCAAHITVALTCAPDDAPDAEAFLPDALVAARIREMAGAKNIPVETRVFTQPASPCASALAHLERNLFAMPARVYREDAPEITVFAASDRQAETEALCDAIRRAAQGGVRYRDMAVIVSDPDAYMLLVERVFKRREIPVFLDRKRPVAGHAAVSALLAAVKTVCAGFPANDFIALAKSGYAGVSQDDAEMLALYLLKTGQRGNALLSPFTRGEPPAGAERARSVCAKPLLRLRKGLSGRSVREKARAVYAYMADIELGAQLHARAEKLLAAGRIPLMEEHAQVWNTLVAILDQLDAILGDIAMGRDAFLALLTEGLSASALGVIPSTGDAVLVGDLARTKSRAVRALFVLGANDGLLPASRGDDAIIDDAELSAMERAGVPVWQSSATRAEADRLDLYTALSKARESLRVSWSFTGDGAELAESALVSDVLRLFPRCRRGTDIAGGEALPNSQSEGIAMLSRDLCAFRTDQIITARLPALLSYFSGVPAYEGLVGRLLAAGSVRFRPAPLGRARALTLYGKDIRMSASRLEQFAACPFKHFMRYGLAAAENRAFTERAADYGTLYHAALAAFVTKVPENGGWEAMDDERCDALLDGILPAIIAEHNDGVLLHNERLRAALFLTIESIRRGARAIAAHIRAGAFTPVGAELRFGENEAFPPIPLTLADGTRAMLSGVIDRVDAAVVAGQTVLRVVDYKLGGREFDFTGILQGLTLQLPLYLAAVTRTSGTPAGMYYMPLTMPAVDDGDDVAAAAAAAFRLAGITLSDASVVRAGDRMAAEGASSVLLGVRGADGETFSGSVCTREELSGLLARAREVSEKLFARMLDGHIEADPAERACAYCDYKSACRFDPMQRGCRTRKYKKCKQNEFFEMIGGDAHALDR